MDGASKQRPLKRALFTSRGLKPTAGLANKFAATVLLTLTYAKTGTNARNACGGGSKWVTVNGESGSD